MKHRSWPRQEEMKSLVAALVHARNAVVPTEAVLVHPGPEEADTERAGGEDRGEDAAAHGRAGRVVIGEAAETDAGVAHAGGGFAEGEEEELIQQRKNSQSAGRPDGRGLQAYGNDADGETRWIA